MCLLYRLQTFIWLQRQNIYVCLLYTVNFALLCEYIGLEKMKKVISFFLPNYSIYTIAIIAEILMEQDDETLGIFYTSLSLLCKIDISKFPLFLFKVK